MNKPTATTIMQTLKKHRAGMLRKAHVVGARR